MLKRKKLKSILSVTLTLSMLVGLLNFEVCAESTASADDAVTTQANTISADIVGVFNESSSTSFGLSKATKWTDKKTEASTTGYNQAAYYIFKDISSDVAAALKRGATFSVSKKYKAGHATNKHMSVRFAVGTSAISDTPTVAEINAYANNGTVVSAQYTVENTNKEYKAVVKIPESIIEKIEEGVTIVAGMSKCCNDGYHYGGAGTYPPTISFEYGIDTSDITITDVNGAEIEDNGAVPVLSKYKFSLVSHSKIEESVIENGISIKDSDENEVSLSVDITEDIDDTGSIYTYDCVVSTPVLAYGETYTFNITEALVNVNGVSCSEKSVEFTTAPKNFEAEVSIAENEAEFSVTALKNVKLVFVANRYNENGQVLEVIAETEAFEASGEPKEKKLTFEEVNDGETIEAFCYEYTGQKPVEALLWSNEPNISDSEENRLNKNFELYVDAANAECMIGIVTSDVLGEEDESLMMTAADLTQKAVYLEKHTSDENGIVSFLWNVKDYMKSRDYILIMKRNNGFEDVYVPFYYQNPDEYDEVLENLTSNDISEDDFEEMLLDNVKLLNIKTDEYEALFETNRELVIKEVYKSRDLATTSDELQRLLDTAVITQQLNNIEDAVQLKESLEENKELYNIETSAIYDAIYKNTLPEYDIDEELVFEELKTYSLTSTDEVRELFELAIMKTALLNLGNYRNSYDILSAVKDELDISFTAYNKLDTNKDDALKAFVKDVDSAKELSDIKKIFNESVSDTPIPKKASSNGGGGGKNNSTVIVGSTAPVGETTNATDTKLEIPSDDNSAVMAFDDFSDGHWAYSYVERLNRNGYINGYSDNSFKPENKITRAEFVSIIMRSFALEDTEASCSFMDVSKESWYYQSIASAFSKGIVSGVDHDFFVPDNNISREDAAVILTNVFKHLGKNVTEEDVEFNDKAEISGYAYTALGYLNKAGIFNGYENGDIRPKANLTRAEACKIISQAIDARWN